MEEEILQQRFGLNRWAVLARMTLRREKWEDSGFFTNMFAFIFCLMKWMNQGRKTERKKLKSERVLRSKDYFTVDLKELSIHPARESPKSSSSRHDLCIKMTVAGLHGVVKWADVEWYLKSRIGWWGLIYWGAAMARAWTRTRFSYSNRFWLKIEGKMLELCLKSIWMRRTHQ